MDDVNQSRFNEHYNYFVAAVKHQGTSEKTIESCRFALTRLPTFFWFSTRNWASVTVLDAFLGFVQ